MNFPPWRVLDALEYPHWHREALPLAANPLRPLLADVAAGPGGRRLRSPAGPIREVLDEDDDAEGDEESGAEQGPRRQELLLRSHGAFEP